MRSAFLWLLLGFIGLEAIFVRIAQLGDLRQQADAFVGYAGVAFLMYLGLAWKACKLHAQAAPVPRRTLAALGLGAVVFRLTLVELTPTLSDDIYRYLWDGRVQQAGINPYRYAPQDEELAWLRTEDWRGINHKDIPTIYPPLMQRVFRVGAWFSPTIAMQKRLFVATDFAVLLFLVWALPRWGVSPIMSLIYAWHPLVIIEVAGSGHSDPFGVLWLLVGLSLWGNRRRVAGTAAFALCFLSKFVTALLLPFYARRAPKLLGVFFIIVFLGYLPFLGAPHLIVGIGQYTRHWEFNSSLYGVLQTLLDNPLLARGLCGLALLIGGGIMAHRTDDLFHYTLRMIQTAIVLAPVLEPWYLLWLIPLLCIRVSWIWLIFSGLVMLSYMVLVRFVQDGVWRIPVWVKWAEYGPLYGWLLWRGLRDWNRRRESQRHHPRV